MIYRLADALNCQPFCAFLIFEEENMIDISYEHDEVIVKYLHGFIELLRTKQVFEKSEMTEQQIWELSEEIKQQWWDEHKAEFLTGIK